jgi:2-iminoacetate synthase
MLLYAPLYLSSYCVNHCVYCGFRYPAQIERKQLSAAEAVEEARILHDRGFRHVLLVAGDYPQRMTTAYYVEIIGRLKELGIAPTVEIAPQTTGAYAEMAAAGVCGVTLYQETYNEELYGLYHPRGPKVSYDWRLEGLERAAEAGIRRLGLGVLLGLADPREDLRAMMRHARYLGRRFPECPLAFSLPRIREAPPEFETPYPVDDETFIRMYCALRVAFPKATLVLSTRERAELRGRLARICITQMSAGSCTSPGGYTATHQPRPLGKQFPICDHRRPAEVAASLDHAGIQPVWEVPH